MLVSYRQLTLQQKQQIIDAFIAGVECRNIPNYVGVSERAVARILKEAGINTQRRKHVSKKAYYWRIYSRQNIQTFYNLVYQTSLGLKRKKHKIEQILGSYRRG